MNQIFEVWIRGLENEYTGHLAILIEQVIEQTVTFIELKVGMGGGRRGRCRPGKRGAAAQSSNENRERHAAANSKHDRCYNALGKARERVFPEVFHLR